MNLKKIRDEIDKVDEGILNLLEERLKLSMKAFETKKSIEDLKREEEIFKSLKEKAKDLNLDYSFIEDLFKRIIKNGKDKAKWVLI